MRTLFSYTLRQYSCWQTPLDGVYAAAAAAVDEDDDDDDRVDGGE